MNELFGDMKTDEEKSAFFLSGRGYETGVIAVAIQNDVAMAYHRCAEYKKELAALQAEYEKLAKYTRNGIECFASPCPDHSGVNTPPFSEFHERYGGLCLMCVVDELDALKAGLHAHPHNGEQGGEWVRCDERLPTEADGYVWICLGGSNVSNTIWNWDDVDPGEGDTHWKPTGLTCPQPPKSKEDRGHE